MPEIRSLVPLVPLHDESKAASTYQTLFETVCVEKLETQGAFVAAAFNSLSVSLGAMTITDPPDVAVDLRRQMFLRTIQQEVESLRERLQGWLDERAAVIDAAQRRAYPGVR